MLRRSTIIDFESPQREVKMSMYDAVQMLEASAAGDLSTAAVVFREFTSAAEARARFDELVPLLHGIAPHPVHGYRSLPTLGGHGLRCTTRATMEVDADRYARFARLNWDATTGSWFAQVLRREVGCSPIRLGAACFNGLTVNSWPAARGLQDSKPLFVVHADVASSSRSADWWLGCPPLETQLSALLQVEQPEQGGELLILRILAKDRHDVDTLVSSSDALLSSSTPRVRVRVMPGDMIIFNSRLAHAVLGARGPGGRASINTHICRFAGTDRRVMVV